MPIQAINEVWGRRKTFSDMQGLKNSLAGSLSYEATRKCAPTKIKIFLKKKKSRKKKTWDPGSQGWTHTKEATEFPGHGHGDVGTAALQA